jgi:hypothetical protein
MEWPPSPAKIVNIVAIFLLYIGGYMSHYNILISLLILFMVGTILLSDIGDMLKLLEEKKKKERILKEEQEEKELGLHPVM